MKTLETGQEKIQQICDVLRRKTLEPAKEEAAKIVAEAKIRAEEIVLEAKQIAQAHIESAHLSLEQERNVFHSSLLQAGKQSVEALRQDIEQKLFNSNLQKIVEKETADPKVIAKLISAIVAAIDKEGLSTEISAVIPEAVSRDEVNHLIMESVIKQLKEHSVTVGEFAGGAQLRLHDKKMTIDITDATIRELLANYIRKDFRKLLFTT